MTKRGWLIAFEGIDGAGKKTLASHVRKRLTQHGLSVETLRYPDYGSPWGAIIQQYLNNELELTPVEQFFTYFTDILKDQQRIEDLLARGEFVIVDRYFASTIAFQTAQGFYYERALAILELVKPVIPDIGLFIEVDSNTAMQRCKTRTPPDRHERNLLLLNATARQYRRLVQEGVLAKRWLTIDGNKSLRTLKTYMTKIVKELVVKWQG